MIVNTKKDRNRKKSNYNKIRSSQWSIQ